jgi:hypothetical protein
MPRVHKVHFRPKADIFHHQGVAANMKVTRLCISVILAALLLGCHLHDTKSAPVTLESTLTDFLSSPTFPRPEDLANALHLSIGRPTLTSSVIPGNAATLVYAVAPNRWGITRIQLHAQADQRQAYETSANLGLTFDKTYCLKPDNFPAQIGLKIDRMAIPIADGGGTYEMDSYQSPIKHGRWMKIDSRTTQTCAATASLIKYYNPPEVGPLMTTVIPNDLANPFPARRFTAMEFWQKLMALIRLHDGYMGPDELEQAFGLKFTPITITSNHGARRELRAGQDWYFSLWYDVTGPGYQTIQPGVIPNGQGSSATIGIPSFSFLSKSGEFECLTKAAIETDLLQSGWVVTSTKVGLFTTTTFKFPHHDSNISVFADNQDCVIEIRVAGALSLP